MRRALKWTAVALLVVIGMALGALWWITASPTALERLVQEAVRRSNGALAVEGVRGSLLGRIEIRRITYTTPDMRVLAEDAVIDVSRDGLWHRRVDIDELSAALVEVQTQPTEKAPEPPAALALPFDVTIARVHAGRVVYQGQALRDLGFAYAGGRTGHEVRGLTAGSEWGTVGLDLRIAAERPFPLSGNVKLDRGREGTAELTLAGDLLATHIAARAEARGATVTANARVTAFDAQQLRELTARAQNVNAAAFDASLPATAISAEITGTAAANGWPRGTLIVRNAKRGALTDGLIPLETLTANYAMQGSTSATLSQISARLGAGGTITGSARLAKGEARVDLAVRSLDLRSLHTPLRRTQLAGTVRAQLSGAAQHVQANVTERNISLAFDAARTGEVVAVKRFRAAAGPGVVEGSGDMKLAGTRPFAAKATLAGLNPAAFGEYPVATLNGNLTLSGVLEPQWRAEAALTLANSVFRGVKVAGTAAGELSPGGTREVKVALNAGANTLRAAGGYGRANDVLTFSLDAPRLAQLDPRMAGALNVKGSVSGETARPQIDVELAGSGLVWQKNVRIATLRARANGTPAAHVLNVSARATDIDMSARAEGGWDAKRGWTGTLASLENAGAYPLKLAAPMSVSYGNGALQAGPAQIAFAGGRFNLARLAWREGMLETSGDLANLPVAPLLALAGMPSPRTTLRIGGSWALKTTPRLNGTIALAREGGDLITPGDTPLALGLERLRLDARIVNDATEATVDIAAQTVTGVVRASTPTLAPDAALKLAGKLEIASLRILDPLIGTQALVRGSATVVVAGAGTLGAPQLTGSVVARGLGIDAPQYGVRLRDGTLRAEIDDRTVTLREFVISGDEGRLTATGSMARAAGGDAQLAWRADGLRVLNRPDMRLKVDGSGTAALAQKKLVLRGALRAEEGFFEFDKPRAPRLADDIVVIGKPRNAESGGVRKSFQTELLDIDVTLDAGERLRIVGAGLNTELRGKVNLKTSKLGVLEARGVLSSQFGIYYAFGQRLEIERGRLIFDGPLDNPALDIVAKRRNLAVEPGVEVTGTVRVPNVRLTSNPPVSDSEKLAWLTLGHGLQDAGGADLATLQAAASALIGGGNSVPLTQRIANRIGLDELSLKGGGEAGGQVAALGKRLSDKLYLEYQQGLQATSTVLRLSYLLTRSLSLRLETGFTSGIGLFFTRSYD